MSEGPERVVLVTGASRGAGKGIALALARPGTTVYVTGRTVTEGAAPLPGTIGATAAEIDARGATGIAVACDHGDDEQVRALFERIERAHGRLDVLVNNAFVVPDDLVAPGPFWEKSLAQAQMLDVGLRSTYVASWYAAPLLIAAGRGLIVNTSAAGGRCYMHGPAYGAGKAGVDKMAHDMARDLKPYGVAAVSLWMGLLATERTRAVMAADADRYGASPRLESPEYPGRVIDALWADPQMLERSGQVFYAADLGAELGVVDIDGTAPPSARRFLGEPTQFSAAVVE